MENLKQLRNAKGLYQKDVANFLGADRTTYVKYERATSDSDTETIRNSADFSELQ